MGCYNHHTLLKLQVKPATISDICMQGTVLGIVSNEGSKVTDWNWGMCVEGGAVEGSRIAVRVGALAGTETTGSDRLPYP